jgi:hypothetical protein
MDHVAEIRRRYFISNENISEIAKSLKLSRPTVRKAVKTETELIYQRNIQPTPKLGAFKEQLSEWLELDARLPKRRRRTAQRLFECLQVEAKIHFTGTVVRFYCGQGAYVIITATMLVMQQKVTGLTLQQAFD